MFNITSSFNFKKSSTILFSALSSTLLFFSACGEYGAQEEGHLIDSAIEGVEFTTESGSGTTDNKGTFTYSKADQSITFKVGSLVIAKDFTLSKLNSDGNILPTDIVDVQRDNTTDKRLVKLLRVIQSLDDDNNASNGILITDNTKGYLAENINIIDANMSKLEDIVENAQKRLKTQTEAVEHFKKTLDAITPKTIPATNPKSNPGVNPGTKPPIGKTASVPFITVWKTQPDNNDITIYIDPNYNYNYTVDWGDGDIIDNLSDSITHEYASAGEHIVKISGYFPAIKMIIKNNPQEISAERGNNAMQLLKITQWGNTNWSSFNKAFALCSNLDVTATDVPDLSSVESTQGMFWKANKLTGNDSFNKWNMSNVTTMESMFQEASNFNQSLTNWNVSKVTNMKLLFNGTKFNQPLNNWKVDNVTNMFAMFHTATDFNQPLDKWNVSKVTDMTFMFFSATSFKDQNLSSWDVSSVDQSSHDNFIDSSAGNTPPNWN
jgi:surface protein